MTTIAETATATTTDTVTLTIDGQRLEVTRGTTVLEAAQGAGIYIPTLCYDPELTPYGGCRLCVVEIEGMRDLVTSCTTPAAEGMVVRSDTPRVEKSRRTTVELIIANHQTDCLTCYKDGQCELQNVARYLGIQPEKVTRLRKATQTLPIDDSNPAFARDPNKCILCGRCVRACHEIAAVGAIDIAFRGYEARISTFGDKPLRESVCESCGECINHCPTGALVPKRHKQAAREVKTICPFCGIGCSMYLGVRGNEIVNVRGDTDSPVNHGGLCVKGRFGFDFINHAERLTYPLIRREGKGKDIEVNGNLRDVFRQATWDEALDLVASKLSQFKEENGPDSIALLSSAKCTTEENYAVQKFARAVIGTNNVDHCARL